MARLAALVQYRRNILGIRDRPDRLLGVDIVEQTAVGLGLGHRYFAPGENVIERFSKVLACRLRTTREDLAEALNDILAGRKVTVAETEADGCLLDNVNAKKTVGTVTYAKDVAPILHQRCQACHRPWQSAP